MKLILSRKGFDSTYGGVPSPILPDGSLCPLPIPSREPPRLRDVMWRGEPLSRVVSAITNERMRPHHGVHLDPDLQPLARPRAPGWRPLFGQDGAAAIHLKNRGVGVGDLFLFFGWFRRTVYVNGYLAFDRDAPDWHVLFGWLQVADVLHPNTNRRSVPPWAAEHPHVRRAASMSVENTVYVASERLELPGVTGQIPGAGVFERFWPGLRLTGEGQRRSVWRLPRWFYPTPGKRGLSYHADTRRWSLDEAGCCLRTVGRGQEFVLDCDEFPESIGWLREMFTGGAHAETRRRGGRELERRTEEITRAMLEGGSRGVIV
jgi:hypothetical protein